MLYKFFLAAFFTNGIEIFFLRVKTSIRFHVGDVEVAAVPCGFGRAIGNKVGLYHLLCCFSLHIIFFTNKGCIKMGLLVMIIDLIIVSFCFIQQTNIDN